MAVKIITSDNTVPKAVPTKNSIDWLYFIDCYDDYEIFRKFENDEDISLEALRSVAKSVADKIDGCGVMTCRFLSPSNAIFLKQQLTYLRNVSNCNEYDAIMNNIFNIADLPVQGIKQRLLYINTQNKLGDK